MIKSYFSRRCQNKYKAIQTASRLDKGEQGLWQRRFWEHQIRNENDLAWHIDYIHYNLVKHGLVNSSSAWPYSSFHSYVKQGDYDADWGSGRKIEFDTNVGYE